MPVTNKKAVLSTIGKKKLVELTQLATKVLKMYDNETKMINDAVIYYHINMMGEKTPPTRIRGTDFFLAQEDELYGVETRNLAFPSLLVTQDGGSFFINASAAVVL